MSLLYVIPSLITLDEIASATYTTVSRLKERNTILNNMPESRISGLEIQIKQTVFTDRDPLWPVRGDHGLTNAELQRNLDKLNEISERRIKQASRTNARAQTKSPSETVDESECAQHIVDLVHITQQTEGTITHGFIPLTQRESNEFKEEEKAVADAIAEFYAKLNALNINDTEALRAQKRQLLHDMIKSMPERAKYGDIFEGQTVTIDKNGNHVPGTGIAEKPTQVQEIRRLNAIKTPEGATAGEVLEIKDLPALIRSNNTNQKGIDTVIQFQYIRGLRFKEQLRRLYTIPTSQTAPWYDQATNRISSKKLLQSIKNEIVGLKDRPFDKKLEAKLEFTHEFINHSVYEWKNDKTWLLPSISAKINATSEAQIFRLSSNASAGVKWQPTENTVAIAAKIQGQAALAMGECGLSFTWPEGSASHITYQYGKTTEEVVDFGCFHFKLDIKLNGFAGASAMLGADIQVEMKNGLPALKSSTDFPGSPQGAQAGLEIFVGVRAGCSVSGAVEWQDTLESQSPWKKLAEVGVSIDAYLGGTLVAKMSITYADGAFYFRFKIGAAWGIGAAGEWAAGIDVGNIATMAHFVYNSLLKIDFSKVTWVDSSAFAQLTMLSVALVCKGLDFAVSAVANLWQELVNTWDNISQFINDLFSDWSEEKAAELAVFISRDVRKGTISVVLHLSPEGKGQLLNKLIYTNLLNWSGKLSEIAVDGIFDLLSA